MKNIIQLLVLILTIHSPFVFADVKVFQQGEKQASHIKGDLKLDASSGFLTADGTPNWGIMNMRLLKFLEQNKKVFKLKKVNSEVLPLRKYHQDRFGITLRLIQRHHRVHIEGSEIVALFNPKGELTALNSSLVPTPKVSVNPKVSQKRAYQIALKHLNIQEPNDVESPKLLIIFNNETPVLVWNFVISDTTKDFHAVKVQVSATTGDIIQTLHLSQHLGEPSQINIYDASVTLLIPNPIYKGILVLKNGKPAFGRSRMVTPQATGGHNSFEKILNFYKTEFDRSSFDNQGSMIKASINVQKHDFFDPLGQKLNAAWMAPWKLFIFGAGNEKMAGFESALDVVAHEFTHAIVSSTSNLEYIGQPGALNEHLADVFGEIVESYNDPTTYNQNPFLLGEHLTGSLIDKYAAIRNMIDPHKSMSPQPSKVSEISDDLKENCSPSPSNDNCGVHILSGIPNQVAARFVSILSPSNIASGWKKLAPLYYRVMTSRLRSKSDFLDYKNQMMDECGSQLSKAECKSLGRFFQQAEI